MRAIFGLAVAGLGALASGQAIAQSAGHAYEGWFAHGEVGADLFASDRGYWWGPGGPPSDPRITFSLDHPVGGTAGGGLGYDWGNGVRVDASAGALAGMQVDGKFLSASDGSTVGHATDIHGTISALSMFGNLYVEPLRLAGTDSPIQPFITGGLGLAAVSMGEWTRRNPSAPGEVTRSWSGDTSLNLAWTAGLGFSLPLQSFGDGTAVVDFTYRYTSYGRARGGTVAIDPPPSNSPTEAYNFDVATHAITVGLRVPFGK